MTYGYSRVSGRGQVDGEGPARQVAAIEKKASDEGWPLNGIFTEDGICGDVEGSERPAFARLVGMYVPGDRIVIERLDRFARNVVTQEIMLADLKKRGIELVSASAGEDTMSDDPTKVLIRQLLGCIASYDKSMTVAKLKYARQSVKAREGRCEGRKPFGWYPGEKATVQRIRELAKTGMSDRLPLRATWSAGRVARRAALGRLRRCCACCGLHSVLKHASPQQHPDYGAQHHDN